MSTCIIEDSRKIHVFEENGRKLTLNNPDQVLSKRVAVDGCEIKEGVRCDFMLIVDSKDLEIFIELKGTDVKHGIDQIIETKRQLGAKGNSKAYIVCSSSPKKDTDKQNIQMKARRANVKLDIATNKKIDNY